MTDRTSGAAAPQSAAGDGRQGRRIAPNTFWPSNNHAGIPVLDLGLQADAVDRPFTAWGARGARHREMRGTYHFYTDDVRFNALWDNPGRLLDSACVSAVEPNYSIYADYPVAIALYQIYRKRWLARYWQSEGVRIFVDMHVPAVHAALNLMGVPKGWRAYATRGQSSELDGILGEVQRARRHAGTDSILFLVYGGGIKLRDFCADNGLLWIPEQRDIAKGRFEA